jgi:uncharacterized protein
MKIVIAGASGFIGRHLVRHFADAEVVTIDRQPNGHSLTWDGPWQRELEGATAVINLSGSPIAVRFDAKNRQEILSSRIEATARIGQVLAELKNPPKVWINGSAVGYYGDAGDRELTESSPLGSGFLAEVCDKWEAAARGACPQGIRLVLMRTGIVLGSDGGALVPLRKLAKLGLAGTVGNGRQWVSWIHIEDLCRLFRWCIEHPEIEGPVNGTSPKPARNEIFMKRLRDNFVITWTPAAPAFVIRVVGKISGPDAETLLFSQKALPEKAQGGGFRWEFEAVSLALQSALGVGDFEG